MWQDKRAEEPEILDLGPDHYTQEEYDECLQLLGRVNNLLGGFTASKRAFKNLKKTPESILEIGCGGGSYSEHMHRWFPSAAITGIDINGKAIEHASNKLSDVNAKKISFKLQKNKALDYPDRSFDVVTSMLVCHHMTDEELVVFFKESYRVCTQAVIINDLQRHVLAYLGYSLIAPFAFPNRLLWHDGRLSVRRSFHKGDWIRLMKKAGFHRHQYDLKWHWAFRWTLTLRKQ